MSLGANVRNYREKCGLDQTELAERIHVSQTMVSHIEAGRKLPSVTLLADIAKVLDCSLDDLVRDSRTA